ncbi:tryptophan-rich sensory protein [Phormidium sp. LEGE 05292]|uniref:tryptophan-rich sensory protein n=1 Tax=[Phormidium] sp. LEGE 05292 TaxID=767427 RepID=UPI00187F0CAF|nr:tryptophan-rich sensory protein [Phormidium sp. LEGE 05292]MBE9227160.1 tryptophan-rich sensory protein [Phormidium sp. LEGE 05292]
MNTTRQESNSGLGLSIATLIAIFATLIVNILSNFFPPSGRNIGEIANTILQGVLIIPANYAFAIWGLIYLGLIAYSIYQFRPSQRSRSTIQQVNALVILASLAQILWVYLFTVQLFWPSVVAMLIILLPLIRIYLLLRSGRLQVSRERKWFAQIPFSIYLAWISVATIVNIASALYISGWDGWSINDTGWTAIMVIIGTIIAAIVAIQKGDIAFTLVFVWAYLAIALRHLTNPVIWIIALASAIALLSLLIFDKITTSREIST